MILLSQIVVMIIGFRLVKVTDGQLELSPGVFLASYTRLTATERSTLPRGIAYCYRETDAAYVRGLKRVPRYVMGVPKVTNCEAVLFPRVYALNEVNWIAFHGFMAELF